MIYNNFVKVKKNVGEQLMKVPENESKHFFYYHWYLSQVQDVSMEWDSLIIIPQVKMIINIEVKSGSGINALKKAAKQTNAHQRIFKKIFGAHLSQEWKFVKTAFIPNLFLICSEPCENCKKYVITDIQKIDDWIKNLLYPRFIFTDENYKAEYENLLLGIIGYSSLRQTDTLKKKIRDPQEYIQATKSKVTESDTFIEGTIIENVGKDEKLNKSEYLCYMLTPDQLMAVKDPSPHIIIDGDYGCGKTYVLKERTKQFADKYPDEKIAYINLTVDRFPDTSDFPDTSLQERYHIMDIIAQHNFKDYNNVDVVTFNDLHDHYKKHQRGRVSRDFYIHGEECSLVVKDFLVHSTYNHIFIDEIPPFRKVDVKYDFFSADKTYCVTMKYDFYVNNVNKNWITKMEERYDAKRILLKHNMRNSKTIEKLSHYFSGYDDKIKGIVIPNNSIPGPDCYHYHDIHLLDKDKLAGAAILKYFPQPNESIVILTNYRLNNDIFNLYNRLQNYFLLDRNIVYLPKENKKRRYDIIGQIEKLDVKEYLEKPEGILVTDIESFNGAQAQNIIIIAADKFFAQNMRNLISRAMSSAIIIHNYTDTKKVDFNPVFFQSVPGLVRDDNLHEYIHPVNTEQLICNNKDEDHRRNCNWPRIK